MTARVLVTAFEPFGGEPLNPSQELVRWIAGLPPRDDLSLATAVLPVDRRRLGPALSEALAASRPDLVVSLGQATGRPRIDMETTAYNAIDYRGERDNGRHTATGEAIDEAGPGELRSPLPLNGWADTLLAGGHPVQVSNDAGRHLCNAVYYLLLQRGLPAVFIHVPLLPEQALRRDRGEPSLDASITRSALTALLEHVANEGPPAA